MIKNENFYQLVQRLAREAGLQPPGDILPGCTAKDVALYRFASLVAQDCAEVAAHTYEGSGHDYGDDSGFSFNGDNSASAILTRFKFEVKL